MRDNLVKVEEDLERTRADLKLVERENLHFTVKFLGEVPASAAEEVDRRVKPLPLRRMEVGVRGLGSFPDERRPRVVWGGVAPDDAAAITATGRQVTEALEGIGESDDRGFHPHITVARVRSPRNLEALAAFILENASRDFGRTVISSLKLKSSALTPAGPVYTDLREYVLQ
ncbi:MAG: RNA 2',3'-cyclic phosphodiesterase [Nitrososphaerota archaeon]|nr:RNA 2',3'-cyclic phosphodiesterase [Nitrososphaerota archaeon]MDG7021211.1 RNA 2',3'-cyclic phosphodiesterase [Nitrososphaerota archaeon]